MLLGRDCLLTGCGFLLLAASTGHLDIPHNPREREDLYNVFDSMDFDGNPSSRLGVADKGLSPTHRTARTM